MKKFDSKRKGFTLVELLIVIVVIGILSAMMMLSSSEAVSSARATTIVADLRNIKTAALAYYADNLDTAASATTLDLDNIIPYLTSAKSKTDLTTEGYNVLIPEGGDAWFVECEVKGTNVAKIKAKLASRAKSTGLLGGTTEETAQGSTEKAYPVYTATADKVYMLIR